MVYYNGGDHGWSDADGYHAPEPTTRVYADECAGAAIPLPEFGPPGPGGELRTGNRHWGTGFKWAPWYGGGRKCDCGCGKAV